jgi:transcriptional regulator with XRE-family HTH domain
MTSPRGSIGLFKRLLGAELLRLREVSGLKQQDAATHIGKAPNKISRAETGAVGVNTKDLDRLLELYDAAEKDRVWCRHLAENSRTRRGRPSGETTLYLGPKWFRAFRELEGVATEIMDVSSEIVPGILQTESYTRAMFVAQGVHPDDHKIDDTVKVRAERKQVLLQDNAPQYSFVISESSLRRRIGNARVMVEQLHHLDDLALLPNVSIQVIPFDALSFAPMYNFTVFRFGRDMGEDIVYFELFEDAAYLDRPSHTVKQYPELFGQLSGMALGPVESRTFILGLVDQFAAKPSTRG